MFADPRLSRAAKEFIDGAAAGGDKVGVSAITLAEVVYLVEKRRLQVPAYDSLRGVLSDISYIFVELALTAAIVEAMWRVPRESVPDMPDRIIAATAVSFGVPLISRDRKITAASVKTVW